MALLVGTEHALHAAALGLFRRVADGQLSLIVTPIVVADLVYVTRTLFGWTRRAAADRLTALLEADGLVVPEQAAIARALALYGHDRQLDFADAYLAALALEVGPASIASFDADIDRIDGVRRISA